MKQLKMLVLCALAGLALSGCAQSLGSHQPSLQAIEVIRTSAIPPIHVATFAVAPGHSDSMDKSVVIRSVNLSSPDNGSFAQYLQKTLETDLNAAGKLNPNSDFTLQGLLTESDVDSGIGTGSASLGAEFSLQKAGKTVFDKKLRVDSKWDSSFIGAEAIPDAMNQYSSLYDKLAVKLLSDDEFKAALAAPH